MDNHANTPRDYGCLVGCLITTFVSFLAWTAIIKLTRWLLQ